LDSIRSNRACIAFESLEEKNAKADGGCKKVIAKPKNNKVEKQHNKNRFLGFSQKLKKK